MDIVKARLRHLWPRVRAGLLALHVLAVVVLSLPAGNIANPATWRTPGMKADLAAWAGRFRSAGLDTTPASFEASLWRLANRYLSLRERVVAPFALYGELSGAAQGWAMFASPQRHPAEVHVDIREAGDFRPLFRPRSDEHAWRRAELDHNRIRKYVGRFARGFERRDYDQLARWLAAQAARDFPAASQVRVRLYRYATLGPEEVRAGQRPTGIYEETRLFELGALR
jgi:hypothetical protein